MNYLEERVWRAVGTEEEEGHVTVSVLLWRVGAESSVEMVVERLRPIFYNCAII